MNILSQKYIAKFLRYVTKGTPDECWIWKGSKTKAGYGNMKVNGVNKYAHRFSWMIENGEIPNKMEICHKCDNPSCVNPSHLFAATHKENMHDRDKKGRHKWGGVGKCGEASSSSKLSLANVIEIRLRYKLGNISQNELGRQFGVSGNQINLIVHNKSWKI